MHLHWANNDVRVVLPPVGSLRFWDTRTLWLQLEPSRGQWNFARLDKFVDLAGRLNADIVFTLGGTPQWAAANPLQPGWYGAGSSSPPRSLKDWDDYVETLATRYRGKIKFYEVTNEPQLADAQNDCTKQQTFYCSSPQSLVDLVKRTTAVVRRIDPSARVMTPGLSGDEIIAKYVAFGGMADKRTINVHLYTGPRSQPVFDAIARVKKIARQGEVTPTVWNTEAGLAFVQHGFAPREARIEDNDAMGAIARQLIIAAASGLGRHFYYSWDHTRYGLSTGMGTVPEPAADAYLKTMSWLIDAYIWPCSKTENLWTCKVSLGGQSGELAWADQGTAPLNQTTAGTAKFIHHLDSHTERLPASGRGVVGEEPVLVTVSRTWGKKLEYFKY